jgi:hypothetical protein
MASTRGRQVVVPLTNKSGGAVAAGDVVIVDTGNDAAFTTTTGAQSETSLGVAQETIANNATGRVLIAGYAALVNVPASVTRGHYIETHTVAKQAVGSATRRAGSFGQFLTGGTTPTALLWGITDQTASGGGGITEHDYVEVTSNLTVTPTSDATAAAFITGNAVAYDGSTRVKIEFQMLKAETTVNLICNLYDGSTDLGRITNTGVSGGPVYGVRYLTPSAATHTYSIRVWKSSGTSTAYAGAGGVGTALPAFMRITDA